jgi:hypothetical protein
MRASTIATAGLALVASCSSPSAPPPQRDQRLGADLASGGEGAPAREASLRDAPPAPQCLGTRWPGRQTIDPDNPDFEDQTWSKAQVQGKFAEAKQQGSDAYKAYKAARVHASVLPCAFCACGCATLEGHESAIDCFKDMHGFG